MARWTSPHWDQVVCPECQNDLDLQQDDVSEGEVVQCSNCGSRFEVMTNPFELRRTEDLNPTPDSQWPAA
jgi:DNA-directed RNA polymerase subunit RPC12/RpoP